MGPKNIQNTGILMTYFLIPPMFALLNLAEVMSGLDGYILSFHFIIHVMSRPTMRLRQIWHFIKTVNIATWGKQLLSKVIIVFMVFDVDKWIWK